MIQVSSCIILFGSSSKSSFSKCNGTSNKQGKDEFFKVAINWCQISVNSPSIHAQVVDSYALNYAFMGVKLF